MPDALREAGLVEIDVEDSLRSRPSKMVRPAEIPHPIGNSFVKAGDVWLIAYEGASAQLIEVKGFRDIARLLSRPNEPVHCFELLGAVSTAGPQNEVLDSEARREYRQRIDELQWELERAEANNDSAASMRLIPRRTRRPDRRTCKSNGLWRSLAQDRRRRRESKVNGSLAHPRGDQENRGRPPQVGATSDKFRSHRSILRVLSGVGRRLGSLTPRLPLGGVNSRLEG